MEIKTNTIAAMKKLLSLFILMLLPMLASAQTVSDVQNSGCLSRTRGYLGDDNLTQTIILKKEGSILSVEVQNYISNCATFDFDVKSSINEGSDGSPCSLTINVDPVLPEEVTTCECPFNVSFTIRDLEPNSFYLDCLWYKGLVELTEGEALVLENNNPAPPEYFPEGTKWTEIRLDTLKYDSWYSKVGDEWVPNFETIEYYVKGEYTTKYGDKFKCVYTNGPEWTDSLAFLIQESDLYGHNSVMVSVLGHGYDEDYISFPAEAYQFDWSVGKGLYYQDIVQEQTTYIVRYEFYYGIIDEIKEGYFGGVRQLRYVDLDGKAPECGKYDNPQLIDTNGGRIIQGIGITEWNDGECLFGPPDPYFFTGNGGKRHYRSMLVHFERNGEVLYDVWPKKEVAYRPFVEEGKVWKVGSTTGISDGIVKMVEYYYFDGDTIINGKTCKKMMCQRYASPNHPDYDIISRNPSQSYIGAWYEEDKKVYVYNSLNQRKMTYDFSLEANDTLFIGNQPYVIGPKQTGGLEGFKGVYRDILWCFGGDPYYNYNTTWLEGVGGIDGPTVNVYYGEEGHGLFLMSCTVGDEVIYLNDEYEDGATPIEARKKRFDFSHTIKIQPKARRQSGEEQSLYGEYNDQQLGINLDPLVDAYQVCITDESGKLVYEKAVNAGSIVGLNIDISAYAKGRYTVTVENSQESFTGQFETQATGIQELKNSSIEKSKSIYNLQGQRLNSLQKGLNIVNGRKIYVK